ncbi:putative polysaccharide polymerase [Leeuwenhoekiella blandensis MED217]|uniref:Putative polysaccharide polymerase n=1 Tax=Leeuwenhoekiella blandensis (strain CECT 7118 / CCUG 51940 / KCTC 22103 / MED217) TaxID=398720 RepID=A3XR79_LEEBM|nr:putative polysaccharide polymerase [Leeuwenhoekiella blandensis MED217]
MIFFVLIFTLFRGLRWETGTDWQQFLEVFQYADWNNIFTFSRYETSDEVLEFGYVFLNVLIKSLGFDYTGFLLITNFLILVSYYKIVVRFSAKPILVFAMILFTSAFFPVRQVFAAAFIIYSYRFLIARKLLPFIITVLIATTFHKSSYLFFPFYYLLNIRIKSNIAYILFFSVVVLGTRSIQMAIMGGVVDILTKIGIGYSFTHRIQVYMNFGGNLENYSLGLASILLSLFILYLFTEIRKTYKGSLNINVFYNSYLFYFMISEFFRNSMTQFARVSTFFILGFPFFAEFLFSNNFIKKDTRLLAYCVFGLYLYYKLINTLNNFYPSLHVPYESVL